MIQTENLNQLFLGIFFLYLFLVGGYDSPSLINCGLQRFIKDQLWFKHVFIFLSIYIFTFILNWYTFDSLVVEKFTGMSSIDKLPYPVGSFIYSLIIYFIFLLTTKTTLPELFIFLGGTLALIFSQIYMKYTYKDIYDVTNKHLFIDEDTAKEIQKSLDGGKLEPAHIMIQNMMSGGSIVLLLILFYGSYKYYLKQRGDHKKNWSPYLFLLFSPTQCSVL